MEPQDLPRPALRRRLADALVNTLAAALYLTPFVVVIARDFGYSALVAAVACLPAFAYALRYLARGDEAASDGIGYAQQAARYQIGEATRGTAFDRHQRR
ncbi:MAG: hypothetical protein FJX60_05510 [Alphaproteobacteria bacterium]|nr:hypothetical protein [Alphaproteobacteria bacterium]